MFPTRHGQLADVPLLYVRPSINGALFLNRKFSFGLPELPLIWCGMLRDRLEIPVVGRVLVTIVPRNVRALVIRDPMDVAAGSCGRVPFVILVPVLSLDAARLGRIFFENSALREKGWME